jgi:hypothetical protein
LLLSHVLSLSPEKRFQNSERKLISGEELRRPFSLKATRSLLIYHCKYVSETSLSSKVRCIVAVVYAKKSQFLVAKSNTAFHCVLGKHYNSYECSKANHRVFADENARVNPALPFLP